MVGKKIALCQKPQEFFKERVNQVLTRNKISVSENVEFYIVDLLERYMFVNNLDNDPLAIQLLKSQEKGLPEADKIKILKKLGDTSLYVSGFFGDSLTRKVIDLDYYRQMGSIAYRSLSESIKDQQFHELYFELHNHFSGFVCVLNEMSHELLPKTDQGLLQLYEAYLKTGSQAAKKYLVDQGLSPVLIKKNV
ncbi:MAG: hypothetical protein IPM57_04765 [Oligoflexia bacterium]|nr:hypothetical protein [Oligoflexia bacterium]